MTSSVTNDIDKAYIRYSPFISEIRKRLFFTLAIFIICAVLGFMYYEDIVPFVLKIFNLKGLNIVFTSPFQFLSLAMNSALLLGIVAVLPLAVIQILGFIKPALKSQEYRAILALLPIASILFALGFSFGILIMKYVVILFYQKSVELNIGNFIDVSLLLSQILSTATLMGLAFQFPILFTILMRLRVINYRFFAKQRLVFYAISLIFAALLPPTDLLSLFLLFLPLALLFELTLLLNKYALKTHLL